MDGHEGRSLIGGYHVVEFHVRSYLQEAITEGSHEASDQ